ncbi:MAG: L-ribulose-5-phosphate 4-epimerase AraD [Candidatus Gastranaerophilales bacterium]|nr:L-ribulose-5-phosphate 4-epimerase AraD [Candidatus Gastranaerophilales bacterium]
MLENIKKEVFSANIELFEKKLVVLTWGNVSQISENGLVVIKPSGVDYNKMTPDNMVVVDINGNSIEGNLKPSTDLATHLELYKAFPQIKGVCHTHSTYAAAFAQAGLPISQLGTTHSDYFYGDIPCTRDLTKAEVENDYETNTGKVIVETFKDRNISDIPACLVKSHGVFTWGNCAKNAVENAFVLEEIAKMNYLTLSINPAANLPEYILKKHYSRKHGELAYYGQNF